ncbi:Glutamate receptor ionotropic, kainate 3 [Hypsibius exemplaris]|uniref:Glutamate receptor ionotropic, kainate 3 n=1 Tax=Hypsibius exemplaris TaxID=2072580 RepID=A0A1W0WSQ5_HYPEX|nr:Glutamate receptor ionotropic, kainate 3 [Hypsibius exemplaris]
MIFLSVWLLLCSVGSLNGQQPAHVGPTNDHRLNIIVVSDSRYPIYGTYGQLVLDYIQETQSLLTPLADKKNFTVTYASVEVPRSDADGVFANLCNAYNRQTSSGSRPDLILDLTVTPLASATVKSFAKFVEVASASLLCCTKAETIQNVFDSSDDLYHLVFDPPSKAYALDMLVLNRRPNYFVLTKDFGHVQCSQCSEGRITKLKPQYADVTLRDSILAFVKKLQLTTGNSMLHQDDYNEINLLYVFDGIRAVINALLASDLIIPAVPAKMTVSCDTIYKAETAAARSPPQTGTSKMGRRNFGWLFRVAGLTGALGTVVPGTGENNTIIDGKLVVEEQTIEYDQTNVTETIGTWSQIDGLKGPSGRVPRAVTDKRLRVAMILETPFIMKNPDNTTVNAPPYIGYLIDLIQKISDELKFEYELYEVPDKLFGAVDDNGEWNGLIRELIDKKADIGLAPLSVMAERENVVDFTVPYFDLVGVTILMKKTNQEQSLFKFVTVLEPPVWGSIFGAYLLTSLLMFFFDRLSPYSYRNMEAKEQRKRQQAQGGRGDVPVMVAEADVKVVEKKEDVQLDSNLEYGTRVFTLKESLWFCMTSLTPQGGGEAPRNLSGRLVAATWWMFGFIIIASYTANLAAFLTVSRLETQVASLDDLTKQYGIKYAPVENSATETYFKRMWKIEEKFYEIWRDMSLNESMSDKERAELAVWDYPVSDKYTKLWLTMKDFMRPKTTEEGVQWVKNTNTTTNGEKDGFALIGDSAILQYTANLDCDLTLVGEEFSRKPYALAVQEGSVLRDQLSGVILKLLNQRELEIMKEHWWQMKKQKECTGAEDENEGISIQNIGGVFILVLAGTVLASIMLAVEYYWYRRRGAKKQTELKQGIEMASATSPSRHGDNFSTNYNTDYSTRFHNVFSESDEINGNKDKANGSRASFQANAKDNLGFQMAEKDAHSRKDD